MTTNHEVPHHAVLSILPLPSLIYVQIFPSAPYSHIPPFYTVLNPTNAQSVSDVLVMHIHDRIRCYCVPFLWTSLKMAVQNPKRVGAHCKLTNDYLLLIAQFFYLMLCNQYIARNVENIKSSFYIFPLISEPRFHKHAASTTDLIEFHFHCSLSASREIMDSLYGIARTCLFYFYRCTVHFEDSLIITYQQMHQLYNLLFKIGFNH
jgi:hypothetical protein